jgi:hypothetical protein
MASNFKVNGVDLDSIFKPLGVSTPRAAVGFKVGATDIANRYYASQGAHDRISSSTNLLSGGSDLSTLFRDINYVASPTITSHPSNTTVNETSSTSLTVVATGDPTLTYQWRKGGSNLSNGGHYSGVTTATLSISSADSGDDANYDCVVTNSFGSATSNTAHVTVIIIPIISTDPVGGSYNEGDVITLTVSLSAGTSPNYQWRLNGANVGSNSATHQFTLSVSTDGFYDCVVSNAAGSDTSAQANITIIPPVINGGTIQGGNYTLNVGDTLNYTVTVSQGSNLSYSWFKDGNFVGSGSTYTKTVVSGDAGSYSVIVSNGGGASFSATSVLTVL